MSDKPLFPLTPEELVLFAIAWISGFLCSLVLVMILVAVGVLPE